MFSFFKRKDSTPANFLEVKTDMHSHLIPGIDDGAKTIEDSLTLIKELHALGYTAHYYTAYHERFLSQYARNNFGWA